MKNMTICSTICGTDQIAGTAGTVRGIGTIDIAGPRLAGSVAC